MQETLRDVDSTPGLGGFPGGGNGNPLQYSCLENPMDWGARRATVHRVSESRMWLKRLSMHAVNIKMFSANEKQSVSGQGRPWGVGRGGQTGAHREASHRRLSSLLADRPARVWLCWAWSSFPTPCTPPYPTPPCPKLRKSFQELLCSIWQQHWSLRPNALIKQRVYSCHLMTPQAQHLFRFCISGLGGGGGGWGWIVQESRSPHTQRTLTPVLL